MVSVAHRGVVEPTSLDIAGTQIATPAFAGELVVVSHDPAQFGSIPRSLELAVATRLNCLTAGGDAAITSKRNAWDQLMNVYNAVSRTRPQELMAHIIMADADASDLEPQPPAEPLEANRRIRFVMPLAAFGAGRRAVQATFAYGLRTYDKAPQRRLTRERLDKPAVVNIATEDEPYLAQPVVTGAGNSSNSGFRGPIKHSNRAAAARTGPFLFS